MAHVWLELLVEPFLNRLEKKTKKKNSQAHLFSIFSHGSSYYLKVPTIYVRSLPKSSL